MTDMELYQGRPESDEGRLPREIRTYDFLDRLGIPYQRTDHERADNMEACNEIDAILGVVICKNLFLCNRQRTNFYLLMMPGDNRSIPPGCPSPARRKCCSTWISSPARSASWA